MARLYSRRAILIFSGSPDKATLLPPGKKRCFDVDAALVNLASAGISYQPKLRR
jgi:hypothetical protein